MQDSHSCDPGSIPGQCTSLFFFFFHHPSKAVCMHILMNHSEAGLFLCMQNLGYIKNGIKTLHTNTHKKTALFARRAAAKRRKKKVKQCRDPGSNQGPLDLQSNALPTELSRLTTILTANTLYTLNGNDYNRLSSSTIEK